MKLTSIIRKIIRTLSVNKPHFTTTDVKIGSNVRFGKNVVFNCKRVRVGDGTVFQDDITINSDDFEIGDYGTIYQHCFFPGPGKLQIGHNFWMGASSILDCMGGTDIGNNVGIGPHSQLWTHMIYGDVMYGCRFHTVKPLVIEDDVWLVGHCLVSPVRIGARSLAMLGSLVTKDMKADHTYAGIPAKDITAKIGPQFEVTTTEERATYLQKRLAQFSQRHDLGPTKTFARIVTAPDQMGSVPKNITALNVVDRTYTKNNSQLENKLMRFLLPDAKFIPVTYK